MSERVTITLIPSSRYKNNTSMGKFDLVILKDALGKEYRYNIPANKNSEQSKLSMLIGGCDGAGHYCETNKTPVKLTTILETTCGYTWLIQPRLAHLTLKEIREKRAAEERLKAIKSQRNTLKKTMEA